MVVETVLEIFVYVGDPLYFYLGLNPGKFLGFNPRILNLKTTIFCFSFSFEIVKNASVCSVASSDWPKYIAKGLDGIAFFAI